MSEYITRTFTFEGKRYYVRAKTDDEAKVKIALKRQELEEGRRKIDKNMLVSAWAKEWLKVYKEPTVSTKHYKNTETIVNNIIIPKVGPLQLKNVRPVNLQGILNDSANYSSSYLSKIHSIIKHMFRDAYYNGLLLENPAEGLRLPSGKKKQQRRPITPLERKLTLKVAESYRGGTFVLIMLYCGLRPGEVAALTWGNVDLKNNVIHVRQALKADGVIGPPKTAAGYREVPIPKILSDRLKEERRGSKTMLVCTNSFGDPYTASAIKTMFRVFRNKMNIAAGCKTKWGRALPPLVVNDDLTLYCYRHTYCTDLQAAGVPINVAKELMGHSNIAVTAQIYTHKSDVAFNNAADLINAYVAQGVAPNAEHIEISMNSR